MRSDRADRRVEALPERDKSAGRGPRFAGAVLGAAVDRRCSSRLAGVTGIRVEIGDLALRTAGGCADDDDGDVVEEESDAEEVVSEVRGSAAATATSASPDRSRFPGSSTESAAPIRGVVNSCSIAGAGAAGVAEAAALGGMAAIRAHMARSSAPTTTKGQSYKSRSLNLTISQSQ